MSHAGRALARDQMRQYADAVHDWDRAIELGPKEQQATFRIGRARSRLLAGQVAEAMAEIADLTKAAAPILDGSQNYNLACFFALASGKITDKKQEYGNRAMEWLQKAVKAGYTDAAQFKRDTDLESIREREDFKKLIAEMETAKP
jgi:tetratricopeptide (TPR) repeat protein